MATRKENIKLTISAKDKASSKLSSVQKKIIGIGAAYLGWKAITSIISGIVQAGIEHEKVWTDVEASLKRHNIAVESTIGSIKKFSDEMQTLSGISDEVIGKATQTFIDYGQDAAGAMDTVRVAMDLAAGGSMDLMAAVDLLAKASVGYTGTLSRYGIIIDENIPKAEKFAAAIEQINERFGGAAQARAETMAVKMALVGQKFGDLKEELFKLFSPTLFVAVETAINWVNSFMTVVDSLQDVVDSLSGKLDFFNQNMMDIGDSSKNVYNEILLLNAELVELELHAATLTYTSLADLRFGIEDVGAAATDATTVIQYGLNMSRGEWKKTAETVKETVDEIRGLTDIQIEFLYSIVRAHEETSEVIKTKSRELTDAQIEFLYEVQRAHEETANTGKETTRDLTDAQIEMIYDAAVIMTSTFGHFAHRIVEEGFNAHIKLRDIFKRMAKDFAHYFIDAAMKALAGFVAKFLLTLALFDRAANDRMAIQQGQHFAQFFKQGVMNEMNGYAFPTMLTSSPMPAIAFAGGSRSQFPSAGIQVTVNVNAPITSDQFIDFVVHDMAPIIERASELGQTRIAIEPFVLTGDSGVIIT